MARVLLSLAAAAAGLAAWQAEVLLLRGWSGLAWLEGFQLAAIVGCLAAASAALIGGADPAVDRAASRRWVVGVVASAAAALVAFGMARTGLYWLSSISFLLRYGMAAAWLVAGLCGGALVIASAGLSLANAYAAQRRWRWSDPLLFAAGLLLVIPASLATIQLLPAHNGARDFVHAVKMGYPVFWAAIACYAAGRLVRRAGRRPSGLSAQR